MLYYSFLAVHIAAGSTALLAGPLALAVAKGGRAHARIGRGFYYAMLVVAATALVLAVSKSNPFLFAVGIFSGYLNLTGTAVLQRKQRGQLHQTGPFEWALAGMLALACLYFGGYGAYLLLHGNPFGLVFLGFVFGGQRMLRQDWQLLRQRGLQPTTWLTLHISRMVGTCIAAYTAFFVNALPQIGMLGWFLPTLVGAPLVAYWLRRVQARARPAAVAAWPAR